MPTGTPLKPTEEKFLTGYEQAGLAAAMLLIIGLGTWKLSPAFAVFLIKRFNPWASTGTRADAAAHEQSVAEFAAQLQVASKTPSELAGSREHVLSEFFQEAGKQLKDLRNLFTEISASSDEATRQKNIGKLCAEVASLKTRIGTFELAAAWLLASVLEKLLSQLGEKPSNITPSTLRTAAGALILLKDLCAPGVRADLATNPAIRFLAVDDDPISRRAVSMSLKRVCPSPALAENGEAALELAARQAYDAIFLDVEMPGLDGFEVCTKLHQLEPNRTTPVVFVTSHSDFDSRVKSTSSGGRDLIAKPFLSSEVTLKALTLLLRGRLERDKSNQKAPQKEPLSAEIKPPSQPAQPDAATVSKPTTAVPGELSRATDGRKRVIDLQVEERSDSPTISAGEYAAAFATQAGEHLREMQKQVAALTLEQGVRERQELLGDLYLAINVLRSEAARAGLKAICQLASALGKLIAKLLDRPALSSYSAFHAIAATIELLDELSRGRLAPDMSEPRLSVLVVDDDPMARRAISNALQLHFAKPDNAESGEAALAIAENKNFDVIFLDILMPEMDGFETCSKIRGTKLNGATPIVFVTSQRDLESREKSVRCGGNGFISKPVLPAEIFLTAMTFSLRARIDKNKAAQPVAEIAVEALL